MSNTTDELIASLTGVVIPARVPLPALDEPYPLGDDTISDLVVSPHELMVVGDIGSHPLGGFVVGDPIFVTITQVFQGVPFTFVTTDVNDERRASNFLNQELGPRCNHGEPF